MWASAWGSQSKRHTRTSPRGIGAGRQRSPTWRRYLRRKPGGTLSPAVSVAPPRQAGSGAVPRASSGHTGITLAVMGCEGLHALPKMATSSRVVPRGLTVEKAGLSCNPAVGLACLDAGPELSCPQHLCHLLPSLRSQPASCESNTLLLPITEYSELLHSTLPQKG